MQARYQLNPPLNATETSDNDDDDQWRKPSLKSGKHASV